LEGEAQVVASNARVLTHEGFGATRLSLLNGLQHLTVLVLRHHQQIACVTFVGLHADKTRG
jgi:hypothetical protein